MALLKFKDLKFEQHKGRVRVKFLDMFYMDIAENALKAISPFEVKEHEIDFKQGSEQRAKRKFDSLLDKSFLLLKNRLNHKPAVYIHRFSGIPLMGTNYFGLVDRGTNIIEVKPMTGCNLNCNYCSVDEGPKSRHKVDYVVEEGYLVQECRKLIDYKQRNDVQMHIAGQGEPLLYPMLLELIRDLKAIKAVKEVYVVTNGLLLTKSFIDRLAEAGLTRINLSLNAMDQQVANKMAGMTYNLRHVCEMARYAAQKMDIMLVPVLLSGINEQEMPKLMAFAKEIGAGKRCPPIGIQNFLYYRFGRNPAKQMAWEGFYKQLEAWEKEFKMPLIFQDVGVRDARELPKPFRKGTIVEAEIRLPGRIKGEKIAVANGRCISVMNCDKEGKVRVKIVRTKHNIFSGVLA